MNCRLAPLLLKEQSAALIRRRKVREGALIERCALVTGLALQTVHLDRLQEQ